MTKCLWHPALIVCFCAFQGGCLTKQYSYFTGTVAQGGGAPRFYDPKQAPIGSSEGDRPDKGDVGIWAFHVVDVGWIAFKYDKEQVIANNYNLNDRNVRGVWYAPSNQFKMRYWETFLTQTDAQRQAAGLVFPMKGTVEVENWTGSARFAIKINATATDPQSTSINGTLTTYDQLEWHPIEGTADFFYLLSLLSGQNSNNDNCL